LFVYQRGRLGGGDATVTTPGTIAGETSPSRPAQPPVEVAATVAQPARPLAAPAQPNVTVVIESTPPGARVVGTRDGKVLGQTPLTLTRAATGGELAVRIEKDGY